jgi:hypothetical protein
MYFFDGRESGIGIALTIVAAAWRQVVVPGADLFSTASVVHGLTLLNEKEVTSRRGSVCDGMTTRCASGSWSWISHASSRSLPR